MKKHDFYFEIKKNLVFNDKTLSPIPIPSRADG